MNKKELLAAAIDAVAERGLNYGAPEDNFTRIVRLWNVHLSNRYSPDRLLDEQDVAMMMALMKIARLETQPGHMDSWVDLAGYAACGGEIAGRQSDDA